MIPLSTGMVCVVKVYKNSLLIIGTSDYKLIIYGLPDLNVLFVP